MLDTTRNGVRKKGVANKVFSKTVRRISEWRTIKKNGKLFRLLMLQGGYKEIRELEGRETNKVDLTRTRKLFKDFSIGTNGKNWLVGFKSEYGDKVSRGQEEHFGRNIWGVSVAGNKIIDAIIQRFLNKKNATT